MKKMKKMMAAAAAAGTLALALGFAACGTGGLRTEDRQRQEAVQSAYGFSAASAGLFIAAGSGSGAAVQVRSAAAQTPDFDGYLALAEGLLSEGGFSEVISASDREGYAYRMDVTYTGMAENTLTYSMYYNETLRADGDFDDDDDDRDDRFDDETEEEYGIEGVMVIEGAEYAVRGERSVEAERGEEESETELRVQLAEGRVMLVEQGYENEEGETEREYTYTVLEDGRAVERSVFSYEREEGEEELKMVYTAGGESRVLTFERERHDGREVLFIRATENGQTVRYIARAAVGEDGQTYYEYEQIGQGA